MRALAFAFACALAIAGCKNGTPREEMPDAAESPQAQAVPAPLANATTVASAAAIVNALDGGAPPTPMRADLPLHDDGVEKPVNAVSYKMTLRPLEPPSVTKAPEVSAQGLDVARKKTESSFTVDLGAQRMRITLDGGFPLPPETELRARMDRTGHLVFVPGDASYHVVPPSALRALLGERRFDVVPIPAADVTPAGEGARRFGQKTRRVRLEARGVHADVELLRVADAADSASLACRFVLEIVGASPMTPACAVDEIPTRAEIHWAKRGGVVLEIATTPRRLEIAPAALLAPPSYAPFSAQELPTRDGVVWLSEKDLAALRTAPVEPTPRTNDPEGLSVINNTDELRVLWLDGVMTGWVPAGGRVTLKGLLHGRYQAELRPFLSDGTEAPENVSVPGSLKVPAEARAQN
jgi:hypothetical protein